MDPATEKLFSDFKENNTIESINEMHKEIYKYLPNKLFRIPNITSNEKCHICNKKAIYVVRATNENVCWNHGIEINKNN